MFTRFVAPCLWHPDMTQKEQDLAFQSREAHRNPNRGMRKGTKAQISAEKNRRSNARKTLQKELAYEPTEREVLVRVHQQKKAKSKLPRKPTRDPVSEFHIFSARLRAKHRGKQAALLLKSQASRLLGVKGAQMDYSDGSAIEADSDTDSV